MLRNPLERIKGLQELQGRVLLVFDVLAVLVVPAVLCLGVSPGSTGRAGSGSSPPSCRQSRTRRYRTDSSRAAPAGTAPKGVPPVSLSRELPEGPAGLQNRPVARVCRTTITPLVCLDLRATSGAGIGFDLPAGSYGQRHTVHPRRGHCRRGDCPDPARADAPAASNELREITIGILAWAKRLYGVKLFAFSFLSNHFHLCCRSGTPGSLPRSWATSTRTWPERRADSINGRKSSGDAGIRPSSSATKLRPSSTP